MKILSEECGILTIEIEREVLRDICENAKEGIRARREALRQVTKNIDEHERKEIKLNINEETKS